MLLERLYAEADVDDRPHFVQTLIQTLTKENARVVARTLAATGNLCALNNVAEINDVTEEVWRGLIHVLRFESTLFGEAEFQTIESAATQVLQNAWTVAIKASQENPQPRGPYRLMFVGQAARVTGPLCDVIDELRSVVSRIQYLRLAAEIREGANPAIDKDRQILLSRLQAMGFSDALSNASNEIENRARSASSETDVKSTMDLLRTFYEEFTEEACKKIEPQANKPVPSAPGQSHYAPYRQYLQGQGVIGPEESELLQKLYNFLSNQGAHKLGGAPEQLRVAQATVVEWCMLVAGRVEQFRRQKAPT